jgi:hypothetical protein
MVDRIHVVVAEDVGTREEFNGHVDAEPQKPWSDARSLGHYRSPDLCFPSVERAVPGGTSRSTGICTYIAARPGSPNLPGGRNTPALRRTAAFGGF